jgi:hypothetical protein
VRGTLATLRQRFDLTRIEYTRRVRIAPNEIPHSHPVLTLNTRVADENALLATYIHEQMHWYLWRLGSAEHDPLAPITTDLMQRYPNVPTAFPEGAADPPSSYMHLVVNWLEIDAVANFLGRAQSIALAQANPVYCWIYRTVIADWEALGELYRRHGIVPIRPATVFAAEIAAELSAAPGRIP